MKDGRDLVMRSIDKEEKHDSYLKLFLYFYKSRNVCVYHMVSTSWKTLELSGRIQGRICPFCGMVFFQFFFSACTFIKVLFVMFSLLISMSSLLFGKVPRGK